jgi:hypothetical protein
VEVLWPVGLNRSGRREREGELKVQLRAFCPIMLPLARARAIDQICNGSPKIALRGAVAIKIS